MVRPRTTSLEPEEMIKLGEEMVAWVIDNKPIHLSMWYSQLKDFTDKEWNAMRQLPEFLHYYEKALKLVGYSYLDKDSNVDARLKDRWQRVYFKDLKNQEDQDADERVERESKLKQAEPANSNHIDIQNELMEEKAKNARLQAEYDKLKMDNDIHNKS